MDASFGKWINDAYNKARYTAENVSNKLTEGAALAKTAFYRSLSSSESAQELEAQLVEYSELPELLVGTLSFWLYMLRHSGDCVYYDDENATLGRKTVDANASDDNSDVDKGAAAAVEKSVVNKEPLTFRHVLLRCDALENAVRTFITSRARGKSAFDESDVTSIKSSLQELFSCCLVVAGALQAQILNLVCQLKPVDDAHVEMVVELVSILKYNWRDEVYFDQRQNLAAQISQIKSSLQALQQLSNDPAEAAATTLDESKLLQELLVLHRLTSENLQKSAKYCEKQRLKLKKRIANFVNVLNEGKIECKAMAGKTPRVDPREELGRDTMVFEEHISQCDRKIKTIYETLEELLERKQSIITQLEAVEAEIAMQQDMLNIKQQERQTAEEQLQVSEVHYNKVMEKEEETRNIYRRKLNDFEDIQNLTRVAEEQLGDFGTTLVAAMDSKAAKTTQDETETAQSKAKVDVELMKQYVKQLQRLTEQLEALKDPQATSQTAAGVLTDVEHILRQDLEGEIIKVENAWSEFVQFHGDYKSVLEGVGDVYQEMHTLYTQAKQFADLFL